MANHGAAALLIASLLMAVTLADARFAGDMNGVAGFVVKDATPVPALTCNEVHAAQVSETCSSVAQGAGLSQAQFLGFNPNINCDKVFLGQWVCLDAVAA